MTEDHPLAPFLPAHATHLFLGSFPPPKTRWSMEFFYPNFINDFWRVMGLIFFADREHFVFRGERRFDREAIVRFATERGLAFYDTACRVRRLRDNADDKFLEIVCPTDLGALLAALPHCRRVVATGQKAAAQLLESLGHVATGDAMAAAWAMPRVGESFHCHVYGRELEIWRMPSTSRAYPLALERKAELYRRLFQP